MWPRRRLFASMFRSYVDFRKIHSQSCFLFFCSATREAELCLRNFANNCVKPFARQYINLLMAGPTQVLRKRCSSAGIKRKCDRRLGGHRDRAIFLILSISAGYLEHKACINATKTPIDVCTENAIKDTMRILKAKKEDWISLSCW